MSSPAASSTQGTPVAPPVDRDSASPRRHLRIGIIQRGRIVEERVLRAPRTVTFGPAANDTFITPPDDGGSGSWRLFEERRGRIVLRLGPRMTARVAVGAQVLSLDAPATDEGTRIVPLDARARGKITRGDTTVLFQLVRPPARQPRPQLPISVRRHVIGDLDGWFTALVALSFLVHLAMVLYLRHVDWPRRPAIDELPDRFIRMSQQPRPPAAPAAKPVAVATPSPKPAPARQHPTAAPAPAPPKPAPSEAERRAALQKQVEKVGVIAVITSLTKGGVATPDLLAPGIPPQAVDDAFNGVSSVTVAQADALRILPRAGDGTGRMAKPSDLRIGAHIVDAGDTGTTKERGVGTVVTQLPPQIEDGKVDAAAIAREIHARRRAIAACYERALKTQPTLAGKLVLRFSLAAAGTVTAADIDDDSLHSPEVAGCIRATVLRWRFPALADGPAELSFPFVFQPGG